MLLIKNGNLITMAGMYEQTGDILIDDGKIVKVGQVGEVPEDCQIIDAAGRTVTPGLVDPHCHAGLWGTACREEIYIRRKEIAHDKTWHGSPDPRGSDEGETLS